jgi:hypothetical protein
MATLSTCQAVSSSSTDFQRSFTIGNNVQIRSNEYFRALGQIIDISGTGRHQRFAVKLRNNKIIQCLPKDISVHTGIVVFDEIDDDDQSGEFPLTSNSVTGMNYLAS